MSSSTLEKNKTIKFTNEDFKVWKVDWSLIMNMQEAYYDEPLKDTIYIKGTAYEFKDETAGKTTYDVYKDRVLKFDIEGQDSTIIDKINNGESVSARDIAKKLIGKRNKYEPAEKGQLVDTIEIGEDEDIAKFMEKNQK